MNTLQTIIGAIWVGGMNLSHRKCLEALIRALMLTMSVNLARLARAFDTKAEPSSTIRRMERLLALRIFSITAIGKAIVSALPPQKRYILTMDRTTWELGKRVYNILAVGICFDGISIPIYFRAFEKRGATNYAEQISFMESVLDIIPARKIECLVADREFGYSNFIKWLGLARIPYCLRLRENSYIHDTSTGANRKLKIILSSLASGDCVVLADTYIAAGKTKVRIYATRRKGRDTDSLLILATPVKSSFTDKIYRLRWQIETTFRALKTSGFNMEKTHLPLNGRFQNMLAIIIVAYACVFIRGLLKSRNNAIPIMKRNGRKRFSIFTFGVDFIIEDIWNDAPPIKSHSCRTGAKNCHVL